MIYGRRRVASECERATANLSFKAGQEYDGGR